MNSARPIDQQLHNMLLALAYPQTHQRKVVMPYLGYGSQHTVYMHGHSLKKPRTNRTSITDSRWRNSLNGIHRFSTREIPHTKIKIDFEYIHRVIETNETGYFDICFDLPKPLADNQLVAEARFRLNDQVDSDVVSKVIIPPTDAEFGVISDLDDTVIQTHVNRRVRMLWNTFAHNAYTREPVIGVPQFYRGLQAGISNTRNPFFYVTSSPLKLYGFTLEFFEKHNIPLGPFLMRNIVMQQFKLHKPPKKEHKIKHISRILTLYPDLPFILIGDNGELDAEIYLEIVKQFPAQVQTIYVHEVEESEEIQARISQIEREVETYNTEFCLVKNNLMAAKHAFSKGYIQASVLDELGKLEF